VRLVILAVLAIGIVVASLATASALLTGAGWARVAASTTAALLFVYGAVQIVSGFLFMSSNQAGLIFAGIMYILLGIVANWIGSMVQRPQTVEASFKLLSARSEIAFQTRPSVPVQPLSSRSTRNGSAS
jgi:hypothetical protein